MILILGLVFILLLILVVVYRSNKKHLQEISVLEQTADLNADSLFEMKKSYTQSLKILKKYETQEEDIEEQMYKIKMLEEKNISLEEGIENRNEEISKLKKVHDEDISKVNNQMSMYKQDTVKERIQNQEEHHVHLQKVEALEEKYHHLEDVSKEKEKKQEAAYIQVSKDKDIEFESRISTLRDTQETLLKNKDNAIHSLEDNLSLKDQDIITLTSNYEESQKQIKVQEEQLLEKTATNKDVLASLKSGMSEEEVAKKFSISVKKVSLISKFDHIKQEKSEKI